MKMEILVCRKLVYIRQFVLTAVMVCLSLSVQAMNVSDLQQAAKNGDVDAQFSLGEKYRKMGGEANYTRAFNWFNLAAEQGDPSAQYNVGVLHAQGQGVKRNYAEAVKWYKLAANQGHMSARFNLGVMYGEGQGVPADFVEAFRWFNLAATVNKRLTSEVKEASKRSSASGFSRFSSHMCFGQARLRNDCSKGFFQADFAVIAECSCTTVHTAESIATRRLLVNIDKAQQGDMNAIKYLVKIATYVVAEQNARIEKGERNPRNVRKPKGASWMKQYHLGHRAMDLIGKHSKEASIALIEVFRERHIESIKRTGILNYASFNQLEYLARAARFTLRNDDEDKLLRMNKDADSVTLSKLINDSLIGQLGEIAYVKAVLVNAEFKNKQSAFDWPLETLDRLWGSEHEKIREIARVMHRSSKNRKAYATNNYQTSGEKAALGFMKALVRSWTTPTNKNQRVPSDIMADELSIIELLK